MKVDALNLELSRFFTPLKLCLAAATHNLKYVKIIHINMSKNICAF